jgi:D-alanyl-D-alanine carboxypeptidase/D-alanyl-D-alanine-endopeptidase (penicillin-binding protein 4)
MTRRSDLKACAAFAILCEACHPQVRLKPDTTTDTRTTVQRDIDSILSAPELARGSWGVLIKSLKTGETLYSLNANKLLLPASNMKIVTLAAAAEDLGWNYTYTTSLRAGGAVLGGVLDGSLVVVGSGDPSLAAADGVADRVFADWTSQLKAAGVRSIVGGVVGLDNPMDDEALGAGWMWDDLVEDYAAGVGALQLNEDAVRVTVSPGPAVGTSAGISVTPFPGALTIDNGVTTAAASVQPVLRARRLPGSSRLELRGSIPLGQPPVALAVSVDNPTQFFVDALRTELIRNGISVDGPARVASRNVQASGRPIVEYRSPPLSVLAVRLMKISQNQYAETLYRTIGGREGVLKVLQPWGVTPTDLVQRDGSGLSRYDLVTPQALVTILAHVAGDAALKGPFEASLPVAGDLGLTNRMKGTPAEGNARAKTGSMTAVRALSGYVTGADGEPLVYSIIANNFEVEAAVINRATDAIVVRLAQFKR